MYMFMKRIMKHNSNIHMISLCECRRCYCGRDILRRPTFFIRRQNWINGNQKARNELSMFGPRQKRQNPHSKHVAVHTHICFYRFTNVYVYVHVHNYLTSKKKNARNWHRTNTKLAETENDTKRMHWIFQNGNLKWWHTYFDATATATNLKL